MYLGAALCTVSLAIVANWAIRIFRKVVKRVVRVRWAGDARVTDAASLAQGVARRDPPHHQLAGKEEEG